MRPGAQLQKLLSKKETDDEPKKKYLKIKTLACFINHLEGSTQKTLRSKDIKPNINFDDGHGWQKIDLPLKLHCPNQFVVEQRKRERRSIDKTSRSKDEKRSMKTKPKRKRKRKP